MQVRLANERYLRTHPEIGSMLKSFMENVLEKQPEDVELFAASWFTSDAAGEESKS